MDKSELRLCATTVFAVGYVGRSRTEKRVGLEERTVSWISAIGVALRDRQINQSVELTPWV